MSRLPMTLSSVEPMGRETTLILFVSTSISSPFSCLSRQLGHMFVGSVGLQLKGQPLTTVTSGRMSAMALTALLFPVPFWPRINNPPMRTLMALSRRASFSSDWSTMAEKG